jgi:small subunit ribosomal protein S11
MVSAISRLLSTIQLLLSLILRVMPLSWASAGGLGFRGSKKSTPFAAQVASQEAAKKAMEHGVSSVDVKVKGPGAGRENAIRALLSVGIKSLLLQISLLCHTMGVELLKRRRV